MTQASGASLFTCGVCGAVQSSGPQDIGRCHACGARYDRIGGLSLLARGLLSLSPMIAGFIARPFLPLSGATEIAALAGIAICVGLAAVFAIRRFDRSSHIKWTALEPTS